MIRFFRKIRYDLMEKNKTGKYLMYAIGEILLVVIGILIALQINAHYETKKRLNEEIQTLKSLKIALKTDSTDLKLFKTFDSNIHKSINIVLEYLNSDAPYKDSLSYHFGNMIWNNKFESQTSEFESLKSRDIKLISNNELRSEIIEYYSVFESLEKDHTTYIDMIQHASKNVFPKRFSSITSSYYYFINNPPSFDNLKLILKPVNPIALKNDTEFNFFITSLKMQRNWYMDFPNLRITARNTTLLKNIDEELIRLEKKL